MVVLDHVVVDDDAQGTSHNLVVGDDDLLPLWEDVDELLDLGTRPEHVVVGIDTVKRAGKLVVVLHAQIAQLYLVDLSGGIHGKSNVISRKVTQKHGKDGNIDKINHKKE